MRRLRLLVAIALVVAACSGPSSEDPSSAEGSGAVPVRVAAAADLRFAMDDLVAAWEATHPGRTVEPSYGSSGNFLAQIKEGAPFDVFFSADAAYPRELERAGLADVGSTRLYAVGQIVVWVANDSALDVETRGLDVLTDPSVKAIAIANPEHAPYGRAAVAAMTNAGIYDRVKSKLVLGENVSQAAQFVESGNADAGIVALALAVAPTLRDLGRYATVPIDAYPRLEQGAVVLDSAIDHQSAQDFMDFVLGSGGRAILDRYGFLVPPS